LLIWKAAGVESNREALVEMQKDFWPEAQLESSTPDKPMIINLFVRSNGGIRYAGDDRKRNPFFGSLLKSSTKQGRNAAALQFQEMSYKSEEGTMEEAAPHRAGSLHEQFVEETQQTSYRSRVSDAGI
jgi:hypothetical protein